MALFSTLNGFLSGVDPRGLPSTSVSFPTFSALSQLSLTDAQWGSFNRQQFAISVWAKPGLLDRFIYEKDGPCFNITYGSSVPSSNSTPYNISFQCWAGGSNATLTTGLNYTINQGFVHGLFIWDGTQSAAADRIQVYINGASIGGGTNPGNITTVDNTASGLIIGGDNTTGTATCYQPAFFSGTIPAISDVYNGGKVNLAGLAGLSSLISNDGGVAGYDYVKSLTWTPTGSIVTSGTIPA